MACGYAPVYVQTCVKYIYASIDFGVIKVVAFILEHSHITEHSKSVGETLWNEKLTVVVFTQFYCHMLSVSRRASAYVNCYIEHHTSHAPYQLSLGERRTLEVQSTHHAIVRTTLVVLHKLHRTHFLVKLLLRE